MATDESWLPLKEAIEAFADPELLRAYREAPAPPARPMAGWLDRPFRSRDRPSRDPFRFDERIRPSESSSRVREQARAALVADFRSRMLKGELVATGIDPRAPIDGPRVTVPAERWRLLRLNVSHSTAKGGGFELVDVMVRRQRPGDDLPSVAMAAMPRPKPAQSKDYVITVGRPGRPSLIEAIRAELTRRADTGEMLDRWSPEARILAAWAQDHYPDRKAPKAESIERRLREIYNQLKADKKAG